MKKLLLRVLLIVVVLAAVYGGYYFVKQLPQRQEEVPTASVRRGDVVVRAYTRGELRAVRSANLTAPNLFGTTQVTRLAPLGGFAQEGNLIVEFDDAEVQSRIEENQLELQQTQERIKKAEADLAIRNNQDEVELLRARYSVRRAELEVKRNELISAIDARKNVLTLEEAQKRLEKLKSDIVSRREQAEAELAVLQETVNRATQELQREQQRLSQVRLLSPMSGLVAIKQSRTQFFFAGSQMPDIREGDELRPGMAVAEILDLSELEVTARVGELDRANLSEGQEVIIRLDALAEREIPGKIKSLSGMATADVFSNDPARKFDVTFEVDMRRLLEALDADPEQIEEILATAEQNRARASKTGSAVSQRTLTAALGGGMPSGRSGGDMPDARGERSPDSQAGGSRGSQDEGGQPAARSRRRPSSGDMLTRMMSGLSEEDQKKAQDALNEQLKGKQLSELSQEEQRSVFTKLRELTGGGQTGGQPSGRSPRPSGASARGGEAPAGGGAPMTFSRSSTPQFTAEQMANAIMPLPPEENSQLDVLLRPGLLADVEIIVERIPDAINVPVLAVFQRDSKPLVFVKVGNRFEERSVEPLKRSESVVAIAKGLEEGELLALENPYKGSDAESEVTPWSPAGVSAGSTGGGGMPGMPMMFPGGGPPMGGFRGGGGGGGGPRGGR